MKTVFISGISRGIGKALAQKFLASGDFVIGTSTSGNANFFHENLRVLPLKLSEPKSIEKCAEEASALDRKIDILINNAGFFHEKDESLVIDTAVFREVLEVNLIGQIDLTERLIPLMNDAGHIINVSSRRASFNYEHEMNYPCYSISKTALNMFTKFLASRLKGKITISAVHPGFVKTDMNEGEGDITPEEAAEDIYTLANSKIESGKFWFKGGEFPW